MRRRVLVVGWDGADWEIVDDLLARGLLPHLQAMLDAGGRGTLLSTIPSHSWSAWSSFLTGFHPAGHGVWDFVERDPTDPDRRLPVSSNSIVDVAPTLLATQGLRVPGLDGAPIAGVVVGDEPLAEQETAAVAAVGSAVGEVSAQEQDEMSRHLRDLGYIE